MHIFHAEIPLQEGFEVLDLEVRHDRLVKGKRVERPSGWALFKSLQGQPIRCHFCGCQADRWVMEKGRRDKVGHPVLNLYGNQDGKAVMMTRDHIIPKSLGGVDVVQNLRAACAPCNETRSNEVTPEVIEFAKQHPELVDPVRVQRGLDSLQQHLVKLKQQEAVVQAEIARLEKPYRDMGYL